MSESETGSIFFLAESIFEKLAHRLNYNQRGADGNYDPIISFLETVVLENTGRDKDGEKVTYTTHQILQSVKGEDYARHLTNNAKGKPFVYTVESPEPKTPYKTDNLVRAAHDKHAEVESDIIIVVGDDKELNKLDKIVTDDNYPMKVVEVEEAIEIAREEEMKIDY